MIVPGKKPYSFLIGSSIDHLHCSLKMEKLIKHRGDTLPCSVECPWGTLHTGRGHYTLGWNVLGRHFQGRMSGGHSTLG